jgi:predicted nucleic acid-binding protein
VTFADVPAGASLFIDANTFVYHFSPHPVFGAACTGLLDRIAQGQIAGSTSLDVVRDVAHRMMTIEAMSREGWPAAGIARRLRRHPTVVQSLSLFRQAVDEIPKMGVNIVLPPASIGSAAAALSQQHGLLSGDATVVAVMQHFGIVHLASHDDDFDRVRWLTRYMPV